MHVIAQSAWSKVGGWSNWKIVKSVPPSASTAICACWDSPEFYGENEALFVRSEQDCLIRYSRAESATHEYGLECLREAYAADVASNRATVECTLSAAREAARCVSGATCAEVYACRDEAAQPEQHCPTPPASFFDVLEECAEPIQGERPARTTQEELDAERDAQRAALADQACVDALPTVPEPCAHCVCTPPASTTGSAVAAGCLDEFRGCFDHPDEEFARLCIDLFVCSVDNRCYGSTCSDPCAEEIEAASTYNGGNGPDACVDGDRSDNPCAAWRRVSTWCVLPTCGSCL